MAEPKSARPGTVAAPRQKGDTEDRVYVRTFDGELSSIGVSQIDNLLAQQGSLITSQEDLRLARAKREAADAPVQAFAEGAARGASLGLFDVAAEKLGADVEGLRLRQQENPVASGLGEVGGAVLGTVGTGGGGLLARGAATGARAALGGAARTAARVAATPARGAVAAGKAVESLVARGLGGKVAPGVAKVMAKGSGLAAEGAAFGVGQTISESVLDPNYTPDALVSNVGLGAILGGGLGVLGPAVGSAAVRGTATGVRAGANAARLLGNKAAGAISAASGVSKQQLKFLTSSEKALRDVVKVAAKEADAAAPVLTNAIQASETAARRIAQTPINLSPKMVRRLVKVGGFNKVAAEAGELAMEAENMVSRAAAQGGDTVMLGKVNGAVQEYNQAVSKLALRDNGGRWQAALKLRNAVAKDDAAKPLVAQLDDFLESRELFGKLATTRGKMRASGEAAGQMDTLLSDRVFDGDVVSPDKVKLLLTETLDSGKNSSVASLRMRSNQLAAYADEIEKMAEKTPDIKAQIKSIRATAKQLQTALDDTTAKVIPANANREAVVGQVNNITGGLTKAAESMLGTSPLGRAASSVLGGSAGSVAAGAMFGPGAGMVAGLYNAARNPQQFLGTIHRMLNMADDLKLGHQKRLNAWLNGKRTVSDAIAPKLSPTLQRMHKGKPSERRKALAEYRTELQTKTSNPEATMERIQTNLAPIKESAPRLADKIAQMSVARLAWLMENAPQTLGVNDPFSMGETDIDDASLNRFARMAAVVENPASIVDRIARDEVTVEEVQALRQTAPGLHAELVKHLTEQLPGNPNVPYARKLTLGVVFEVPTVAALQPEILRIHQQAAKGKEEEQQPSQPLMTNAPTPAAQAAMSPLDAAVAR